MKINIYIFFYRVKVMHGKKKKVNAHPYEAQILNKQCTSVSVFYLFFSTETDEIMNAIRSVYSPDTSLFICQTCIGKTKNASPRSSLECETLLCFYASLSCLKRNRISFCPSHYYRHLFLLLMWSNDVKALGNADTLGDFSSG